MVKILSKIKVSKSMNGRNNSRSEQNVKCWIFGKTSHIKKHCRASKKKKKQR